ncbi:N-6 DNA methylase [Geobacter pelophilus]|uniref:N-6 DNA methylase n=1 Tax=Geoanaerobacter pelophilus TaxID=60036 RepID=A0AAW4L788_9BACT|nr:N-6 DNA methylase [Geoanaerobacter pelophilus]MBT0664913.1 N-6 DNA methylase [Geoanaerobacter pelophilus]
MTELETRLTELKKSAKERGYTHVEDFSTHLGDSVCAAVCWGEEKGAPTARLLLAAVKAELLADTAADNVLSLAWDAPSEGAGEPVAALVDDGSGQRVFDLDPSSPHEIDQLPKASEIGDLQRLEREPTFRWSLRVYEKLQRDFDNFHEQVYSTVRDTVDGKNDIIDEAAKFLFLELFRLRHKDEEKKFTHGGEKLTLDEVYHPQCFEVTDKKAAETAVEKVRSAFEAFKGHKDYQTTDDLGEKYPIFNERDYLKLSVPRNYATLIRLLQDLPILKDNQGRNYPDPNEERKGTLKDVAGDVLGRAFDVFLRHKFQKEGVGIYLTPSPVKRAMVDIALHDIETYDYGILTSRTADGKPSFRVGDPAGGSAGFLVALLPQLRRLLEQMNLTDEERDNLWKDMLEHSFVAADSSPRMVRLARLNMALQGAPRSLVFNTTDSLTTPHLLPNSFDLILTNPPFGAPKTENKEAEEAEKARLALFRTDIDFDSLKGKGGLLRPSPTGLAMGASPTGKGVWQDKVKGVDLSVLFLDRCLQLLKPGGRLLMVVPDSILCNANTRYLREYLMGKKDEETGQFHGGKAVVKAVISLPADTFKLSGTAAKTSILYVQKRKVDPKDPSRFVDEPQTDVFMAVADTLGYTVKNNTEVFDVPNDLVPIVGAYVRGE